MSSPGGRLTEMNLCGISFSSRLMNIQLMAYRNSIGTIANDGHKHGRY